MEVSTGTAVAVVNAAPAEPSVVVTAGAVPTVAEAVMFKTLAAGVMLVNTAVEVDVTAAVQPFKAPESVNPVTAAPPDITCATCAAVYPLLSEVIVRPATVTVWIAADRAANTMLAVSVATGVAAAAAVAPTIFIVSVPAPPLTASAALRVAASPMKVSLPEVPTKLSILAVSVFPVEMR